jgi:hypothetical protein
LYRALAMVLLAALVVAAGCSRESSTDKGGPGEKAGRAVDRALDKAGKAVEQAGRDMQKSSKGEDTSKDKP